MVWFIDSLRCTIFSNEFQELDAVRKVWTSTFDIFKILNENTDKSNNSIVTIQGNISERWLGRIIGQQDRLDIIMTAIVPQSKKYGEFKKLKSEEMVINEFVARSAKSFDFLQNDVSRLAFAVQAKSSKINRVAAVKSIFSNAEGLGKMPTNCQEVGYRINDPVDIDFPQLSKTISINRLKVWSSLEEIKASLDTTSGLLKTVSNDSQYGILFQLDINTAPNIPFKLQPKQCTIILNKLAELGIETLHSKGSDNER